MKRWLKIALALTGLAVVSQVPFIYRRHQLSTLRNSIFALNQTRHPTENPRYKEYKGVLHVHSNLGGHSTGALPEIVRAAESQKLDFVVMTEHPSAELNSTEQTLNGFHNRVLFVQGAELSADNGDRFLIPKGLADTANEKSSVEILSAARSQQRFSIVAYPADFKSWSLTAFDGIEVCNLYSDAKGSNPVLLLFDGLWSYRSFPDLMFARMHKRPDRSLELYDQSVQGQGRRIILTGGNDAHQNVGFGLTTSAGQRILYLQADPYERSFSILRNHVLVENDRELSEATLFGSLNKQYSIMKAV